MPGSLPDNCLIESGLIFTQASQDRSMIILILHLRKLAPESLVAKVRQLNLAESGFEFWSLSVWCMTSNIIQ